jgi:2-polyprenyl-3-methyl-5-hydroxy-6-metoxy-1,4-benzoquinol methylase
LCKCTSCNLIFTNPRPEEESIDKYYQSEDYISHQNKGNNFTNIIYKWVRNITIKNKIRWLNKYSENKGSLLDIGCGTGYFLQAAKNAGWQTQGIEPNNTAREIAKKQKIKVKKDLSNLKKEKKFSAISLYHVLEHIHQLRKTGKKIVDLLEDTGTIFIAVPNHRSFDAKKYGTYWAAYDVPRHLYHFNQETIAKFADEMGLKIISIEPMRFDSYYVSLLSEPYLNPDKGQMARWLKALVTGYKSNRWGKENDNNYSSLLFILKKK